MMCPKCSTRMDPWLADNGYAEHIGCLDREPTRFKASTMGAYTGTATVAQTVLGDCPHGEPRGQQACPYCRRDLISRPGSLVGAADSRTQRRAATEALPRSGTKRRQLYELVLAAGDEGMTDTEAVIELGPGWDYSRLGPRRRELVSAGFLVDTGRTRPSPWTGSEQTVWCAVSVR